MSFLNLRKKKEVKTEAPKQARHLAVSSAQTAVSAATRTAFANILRRPHITEKAVGAQAHGVFVFEVAQRATKREVEQAVRALYQVAPRKIAIAAIPRKRVFVKGKWGVTGGGKKAFVYLNKGDKLEIL